MPDSFNNKVIKVGNGHFLVSQRPRGGDWLDSDIKEWKRAGFTFVASLLTPEENEELELTQESQACQSNGLDFYSFEVRDRNVPSDRRAFESFASELLNALRRGEKGVFHCRAGLGRAPLLGCTVMVRDGESPDSAWTTLSEKRGQVVPDTPEQKKWVRISEDSQGVTLEDALQSLWENE